MDEPFAKYRLFKGLAVGLVKRYPRYTRPY